MMRCVMHPPSGALTLPFMPAGVICGVFFSHRHSFQPPRCRASQYRRTCVLLPEFLWNDLSDLVFDAVGLAGFKRRANAILLA